MGHLYKERWSDKTKVQAVTLYLTLGKLPAVVENTGIPLETLRTWKRTPWWKDIESQIRTEDNQSLDTKLSKTIDRALDIVVDRLENGDYYIDKSGKVKRTPVRMREAGKLMSDIIDKRSLIRKEPTKVQQEKQESINERLLSLAEQFAAIALGKDPTKTEKIIEGELVNAVYDRGEEGLQEGIELGAQEEAEQGEGSCSTEFGEESDGEESWEGGSEGEGRGAQDGDFAWRPE